MILRIPTSVMAAFSRFFLALGLLLCVVGPASAQDREVPYWASINTEELNMRVGPSMEYRIEWVYRREGLPVKVVRVVDRWRLIEDSEGTTGWVSSNLLSLRRCAVVIGEGLAAIREVPSSSGKLKWNAEPGVIGQLGDCEAGWCAIDIAGRTGWIEQDRIWGAGDP
ncbi:SH3 domain-containing protein [Allopontixanthobacter sp.]|uniref:SH3 domain-containing protein n=1 Tax=Allopontixanthobacter sp. TaxID=2906452 RepID=UPI002AB90A7D|nr:SH3 domain-containing protein [Allopontixanthobacter sp.]MDZ4306542.1 SH3 domain-containing protein [Allopontixanthobacter sp.]